MEVKDFLRARRAQLGMTQEKLATRLEELGQETSYARVGHWETGRNKPPLHNKEFRTALAIALEMDVNEMMAALGRLGWRLRASVGQGFARGYVHAGLAGLAGTLAAGMLGDWFIPFVYNIGLAGFRASVLSWLFLGGLIALQHLPISGGQSAPSA